MTTFNFDIDKMTAAIKSGTISFPPGLTHEERREWITLKLKEIDEHQKNGNAGSQSCERSNN